MQISTFGFYSFTLQGRLKRASKTKSVNYLLVSVKLSTENLSQPKFQMSICTPGVCSVTCLQTYKNFISSLSSVTDAPPPTCGHAAVSMSKHCASLNIPQDAPFHRAASTRHEAEMSATGAEDRGEGGVILIMS